MDLQLHPNAAKNFDEKAEGLLLQLAPQPEGFDPPVPDGFKPDWHIAATIGGATIGEVEHNYSDVTGRTVARWFMASEKKVGLWDDTYKTLRRLSEQMQGTRELRTVVTVETIERTMFRWMADRYNRQTDQAM